MLFDEFGILEPLEPVNRWGAGGKHRRRITWEHGWTDRSYPWMKQFEIWSCFLFFFEARSTGKVVIAEFVRTLFFTVLLQEHGWYLPSDYPFCPNFNGKLTDKTKTPTQSCEKPHIFALQSVGTCWFPTFSSLPKVFPTHFFLENPPARFWPWAPRFHERGLGNDIALTLCLRSQHVRPGLLNGFPVA